MATRRALLKGAAALSFAPAIAMAQGTGAGRVVVIGGGFGGTTAARTLKALEPRLDVTLVEPNAVYTSCPYSNGVLAGHLATPCRDGTTPVRRLRLQRLRRLQTPVPNTSWPLEEGAGPPQAILQWLRVDPNASAVWNSVGHGRVLRKLTKAHW